MTSSSPARVALALGLALTACGDSGRDVAPRPVVSVTIPAGFAFDAPRDWTAIATSSTMRQAQYALPAAAGDPAGAELVVYFFGPGGGGGADANVQRWYGQFAPAADGTPPDATKEQRTQGAWSVTFVECAGRYVAETAPGSGERVDKPNQRLLGAIVEGEGGPLFFKAVGPDATLSAQRAAFRALVGSLRRTTP